jgi:hypothetical protein
VRRKEPAIKQVRGGSNRQRNANQNQRVFHAVSVHVTQVKEWNHDRKKVLLEHPKE